MLLGERPLERGRPSHWVTQKLKRGEKVNGHIAGPCIGVQVHCGPQSRPCLKCYLGATADCTGCNHHLRRDWLGYQPLYRWVDGKSVVVTLHVDQIDRLEVLRHGDHVLLGREDADNAGVWIRKEKGPSFTTTLAAKSVDADICDWLPVLWRMRGILTGAMVRGGPVIPPATGVPPLKPSDGRRLGVVSQEAWASAPEELRAIARVQEQERVRNAWNRARGAESLNGDSEHEPHEE